MGNTTTLLKSKQEINNIFLERINKGRSIIDSLTKINSRKDLSTIKKNYISWDKYNKQFFKIAFSTTEFLDEYISCEGGVMVLDPHRSFRRPRLKDFFSCV